MGFGLLLIGYFLSFAIALSGNSYYIDIAGGFLMTYALLKLADYNAKFKRTVSFSIAFTFASMITAFLSIFNFDEIVVTVAVTLRAAIILLLHSYMFLAIEDMARGADDEKLAGRARRNLKIVLVYFVVYAVITLVKGYFEAELAAYCNAMLYIYRVVWLILNLILIHSAYARLYIEGTEQRFAQSPMYKESRFKFLNNIRKKYYDSQKKATEENYKLMKEARDYAIANRDKIDLKKKKKKKKQK